MTTFGTYDIIGRERKKKYCRERHLLAILYKLIKRVKYRNGFYREINRGIGRGCALSPLFGALYLEELDKEMGKMNVFYVRYMDDWVIMANNRWTFGRAIKKMNEILSKLGLEKAKDKTFIGKVERGFDFLGYHFSPGKLSLAKVSVQKFGERLSVRLYKAGQCLVNYCCNWRKHDRIPECVSLYVQRYLKYISSGLDKLALDQFTDHRMTLALHNFSKLGMNFYETYLFYAFVCLTLAIYS